MNHPDAALYKDKIEVSLDGRQIFYLFFGGAVIASMVFVMGVMIGKRLESRAHVRSSAPTSAAQDPLAALDKLSASRKGLAFPAALTQEVSGPLGKVDSVIEANGPRAAGPSEAVLAPVAVVAPGPEKPKGQARSPTVPTNKAKTHEPAAAKVDRAPAKKAGAYTLQLSSFRERSEADAFHGKLSGAGYPTYVVPATIKGESWYRVRLGHYANYREAITAKGRFERKQKIIAYVTRLK